MKESQKLICAVAALEESYRRMAAADWEEEPEVADPWQRNRDA